MKEIDLRVFWGLFVKNITTIAIVVLVTAVLAAGATVVFTEDAYVSKCSMYVMNITKDDQNAITGISSAGLDASQRMVDEFIQIVRSESVLVDVQEMLRRQNYEMSITQIREALQMASQNDTALLQITATTADPNLSKALCDAVQQCAPGKVNEVMLGIGTITKVDVASMGTKKAPKTVRNGLLGAVASAVLIYAIFLVNYLLDNTIKDERDFKNRFDVNVLGVVPSFNNEADKSRGKKKGAKR